VKLPANYSVESSDDEDGDDPKTKKAKKKLKEMMREDSDAESDFEKELLKDEVADDGEDSSGEDVDCTKRNYSLLGKRSHDGQQILNLSESDSSDEENVSPPTKASKSPALKSSYFTSAVLGDNEVVDEDADASQRLVALADNLEAVKNVWKVKGEGNRLDDHKKSEKPGNLESSFDLEISTLLAQGEGDSMDDIDQEESKPASSKVEPIAGVEVTIAVPDNQRRRKQKKAFDVAAFIKREVSKSRRELFLILHKTHYVCLLAHLTHIDCLLSNPLLKAMGLSLVPLTYGSTPVTKLTLVGLGALVSWLRGAIPVNKHLDSSPTPKMSSSALMRAMQTLLAMDNNELVLVFILICRSLGLATRLVLNFAMLPLKPKGDGGMKVFETANDNKSGPKNRKSEESKPMSRSQESLSSKLSKAASLKVDAEHSISGQKAKSDKKQTNEYNFKNDRKKRDGKVSKGSSRKRGNVRRPSGSDEETENDTPRGRNNESSSKKDERSLSAKLADAAKARLSPSVPSKMGKESGEKNWDQKRGKEKGSVNPGAVSQNRSEKDDLKQRAAGGSGRRPENSSDRRKGSRGEGASSGSGRQAGNKAKVGPDVRDYWAEVYLPKEKRWIVVDLLTGSVNHPEEIESRCSKPVAYCLAVNQGQVKDVTARYASNYHVEARKLRADPAWLDVTLRPFRGSEAEGEEKEEMAKKKEEAPLPTSISQFKGHPLYVLQRHLLKFEAIFPADAPTLGFIKREPVYARECVKILQGRTAWLKEGRTVKLGESPYKTVKARPKWNRSTGSKVDDEALELFGAWQTELFVPLAAVDGKVPRNEYGNVELFKPWMLPPGTVHIPINGMKTVIRKCGIDAAPAMVGWDFSGGGAHPVYDGVVVCQENADALMDAWNQEQEIQAKRSEEKREKRVLDNWKKLVRGLVIKQRIKSKYMKE